MGLWGVVCALAVAILFVWAIYNDGGYETTALCGHVADVASKNMRREEVWSVCSVGDSGVMSQ
eukprot:6460074-Pyramimonas_sp.AAC.1